MNFIELIPYAPNLIESTRSIGYKFETALADVIDNSISKESKNINIFFSAKEPQYIAITDDGIGMSSQELIDAMRYGNKNCLEKRDKDDLGRFGLGLKMASFSQCRRLTVITKSKNIVSAARWDLDYIIKEQNWNLQLIKEQEVETLYHYDSIKNLESGTIVIWENFDIINKNSQNPEKVFNEKINFAKSHISLVFHRFASENKLKISFNNALIDPIDPFLENHPSTQPLAEEVINMREGVVKVKPFILPYVSKLTSEERKKLNDVDNLLESQGFYIYRNKRLIKWGTWFRLARQHELNKLARIRIDIPNTLDDIWELDVKKSTVSLPEKIRTKLKRIVEQSVYKSEEVPKFRGRRVNKDNDIVNTWNLIEARNGSYLYEINRDLPVFKKLEASLSGKDMQLLDSLIKMIEGTIPLEDIWFKMNKQSDSIKPAVHSEDEIDRIFNDNITQDDSSIEKAKKIDFFKDAKKL